MRKKEPWMKKGAIVRANGELGHITAMQENTLNGIDYVYYIEVKLDGRRHSSTFHPDDISKPE